MYLLSGSVYTTYLGGDEEFLPGNPGLFDSHANFGLGPIDLGTVKMTVPGGNGTLDRLDCSAIQRVFFGLIPGGSSAESDGGDEPAPGEFDGRDRGGGHWGF